MELKQLINKFQNYMRVVTARNSSSDRDTVSEYCYKLGLEAGGKETVLGYTAMEGYQVRLSLLETRTGLVYFPKLQGSNTYSG